MLKRSTLRKGKCMARRTGYQVYAVDGQLIADTSHTVTGDETGGQAGVPVAAYGELGYAEIVSASTVTGTTLGDGTTPLVLSNVIVPVSMAVVIEFNCGYVSAQNDLDQVSMGFFQATHGGAYSLITAAYCKVSGAAGGWPAHRTIRKVLTPGAYDFKVQFANGTGARTATLYADSGSVFGPCSLSARAA